MKRAAYPSRTVKSIKSSGTCETCSASDWAFPETLASRPGPHVVSNLVHGISFRSKSPKQPTAALGVRISHDLLLSIERIEKIEELFTVRPHQLIWMADGEDDTRCRAVSWRRGGPSHAVVMWRRNSSRLCFFKWQAQQVRSWDARADGDTACP